MVKWIFDKNLFSVRVSEESVSVVKILQIIYSYKL